MTSTITGPAAGIQRDRYGRPMVMPPGGGKAVAYTRCTTYVDALEDKYNLQQWMQRMVATGLAQRPDLLLAVTSATDDKRKLDDLCGQAREHAGASASATTGTALHSLTELIDRGETLPAVPEAYRADLDAYRRATEGLRPVHIEQFTVLDDLMIGGTPDRVVDDGSGRLRIADVKTGGIRFGLGKIAMQLAVYARSTGYRIETGERFELGDIDQSTGIIIHLPAGKGECELVEVDLEAGWQGVQLATQVRQWRKRKDLARPRRPSQPARAPGPPAPFGGNPDLAEAIATAIDPTVIRQLWADHQASWTDDLTQLASARVALLTGNAIDTEREGERA